MKVIIKQNSPEPAYAQIFQQIKEQIINNDLKPGELLPSIRALAKSIRTSVITVKRAYQDLQDEGLITTVVGKGSFVSEIDKDKILDKRRLELKNDFEDLIKQSKDLGFTLSDLNKLLEEIYEKCD